MYRTWALAVCTELLFESEAFFEGIDLGLISWQCQSPLLDQIILKCEFWIYLPFQDPKHLLSRKCRP